MKIGNRGVIDASFTMLELMTKYRLTGEVVVTAEVIGFRAEWAIDGIESVSLVTASSTQQQVDRTLGFIRSRISQREESATTNTKKEG